VELCFHSPIRLRGVVLNCAQEQLYLYTSSWKGIPNPITAEDVLVS
jgi:hypothetical protein